MGFTMERGLLTVPSGRKLMSEDGTNFFIKSNLREQEFLEWMREFLASACPEGNHDFSSRMRISIKNRRKFWHSHETTERNYSRKEGRKSHLDFSLNYSVTHGQDTFLSRWINIGINTSTNFKSSRNVIYVMDTCYRLSIFIVVIVTWSIVSLSFL